MINDFDDLFERFAILTTMGNMTDEEAFEYLKNKTTIPLWNQLYCKVFELNKKCLQNKTV